MRLELEDLVFSQDSKLLETLVLLLLQYLLPMEKQGLATEMVGGLTGSSHGIYLSVEQHTMPTMSLLTLISLAMLKSLSSEYKESKR